MDLATLWPRPKDETYYIVLTPGEGVNVSGSLIAEAAKLLRLNPVELTQIIALGQALPLGRASTPAAGDELRQALSGLGISSVTVSEKELLAPRPAKGIRGLDLTEESLTAVLDAAGTKISTRWKDVNLIIVGRLFLNRVEIEENKRGGHKTLVDKRELSSDESVLDIYAGDSNWRIVTSSFDFSCLGPAMAATTFENFAALVDMLRRRSNQSEFDDSYMHTRQLLTSIWPWKEQRRADHGRRSSARKFDLATVITTDNESQFTHYSRLRHYLRRREFSDGK